MSIQKPRCIIVLSTKSAGSSALQRFVMTSADAKIARHTRHFERETLYWTKAASLLGLPQLNMPDSEVPLPAKRAHQELAGFLRANVPGYTPPQNLHELVFGGWRRLCETHTPIFLEKSPHHLYQQSALELILEAVQRTPEVDFHLLGLVRHPMSVLYSAWSRWRSLPEVQEQVWLTSYRNLQNLRAQIGDKLNVIRYEDLVNDPTMLGPTLEFLGVPVSSVGRGNLHGASVERWQKDPHFGFRPSEELVALAEQYGYSRASMVGQSRPLWPVRKHFLRSLYKTERFAKRWGKAAQKRLERR